MIDFFKLLQWQGFPVNAARKKWKEINLVSDKLQWHNAQAWEIAGYHWANNKAYANLVGHWPDEWHHLPVMNKTVIKQHGIDSEQWLRKSNKYYWSSTSGSSGKPFRFSKDLLTHTLTWIHVAHCYGQIGVSLNDWQARFYGAPSTFTSKYVEKIKDLVGHRKRFPVLDLSDQALETWADGFKRRKFAYLYGYSYPIISFAKYLNRTQRILTDISPDIKGCILTAEMCDADERQLVEDAIGAPVCNEYGASEFGILGFATGPYWEVPVELIKIEILDEDGRVLPDGQLGNVTITSLFNMGTPFIRYQPGDLGAVVWQNGRQYLTQLYGRREDMAVLPSGKKTPGDTAFYYIFKDFSNKFDVITEYKVIQTHSDAFDIRYVAPRDLNDAETGFLKSLCDSSLEKGLDIRMSRYEVLDRTRMGKFRRFVSEVSR
ncbi:MAG: hypothetical protein QM786_14625 [Breznakibacter sp.]